jgi:hypothetical protein
VSTYLDDIACRICWVENPSVYDISDDDMVLYRIYAVLCLAKGEATTLEDVHDAWAAWRSGNLANHRSLVPFDQLTPAVQALDQPYVDAIHAVARELKGAA